MATITGTITSGIQLGTSGNYAAPLTIAPAGKILSASRYGIYGGSEAVSAVVNFGTVEGATAGSGAYGIDFAAGGSIDNAGTDALISGYDGIVIANTAGAVTNLGTIDGVGNYGVGVELLAAGTIDNSGTGALIEGGGAGIQVFHSATIINAGTIASRLTGINSEASSGGGYVYNNGTITGSKAIYFHATPGTVANSGTISGGGIGIDLAVGGTVIDSGRISGTGAAIKFGGGGNLVILESGYSISGGIDGSGSGNTLEISGSNGPVVVDYNVLGLTNFQTIEFGAPQGNLEILEAGATAGTIDFAIAGFTAFHEQIDLLSLGTFVSDQLNGNLLTVTGAHGTATLDFVDLPGSFGFRNDGTTGTFVDVACFRRGTLILTEFGERPVEELALGERVPTISGEARAIKWIGRRSYRGAFLSRNADLWPILVKAGALEEGVPARDLYLSAHHALFLGGLLIPAECLVNGRSIRRCAAPEEVEYFHIELSSHDVIFAEGAPAETFVDCDSRGMFHNAQEFAFLYPAEESPRWAFCAPRPEKGREVEAVRRRLFARAAELFPPAVRAA